LCERARIDLAHRGLLGDADLVLDLRVGHTAEASQHDDLAIPVGEREKRGLEPVLELLLLDPRARARILSREGQHREGVITELAPTADAPAAALEPLRVPERVADRVFDAL